MAFLVPAGLPHENAVCCVQLGSSAPDRGCLHVSLLLRSGPLSFLWHDKEARLSERNRNTRSFLQAGLRTSTLWLLSRSVG